MAKLRAGQGKALLAVCAAVVEAVSVSGDMGAPGGVLYAALMHHGVTFDQYTRLMGMLVHVGALTQDECELYHVGPKGAALMRGAA